MEQERITVSSFVEKAQNGKRKEVADSVYNCRRLGPPHTLVTCFQCLQIWQSYHKEVCKTTCKCTCGRALCLEYRVSCVRVPPEAAHLSDCLGCAVLLCLVCLFDLSCFFLSSFSSLNTCIYSMDQLQAKSVCILYMQGMCLIFL